MSDEHTQMPDEQIIQQNIELAQLRSEVDRLQRELAQNRFQRAQRAPGGCLNAWLVLQCVALAFLAIAIFVTPIHETPGLVVIAIASAIYVFVSIMGLWSLKKWGYYMQMIGYSINLVIVAIAFFVSANNGTPSSLFLNNLIVAGGSLLALYLMVHDRWEMFE